MPGEKKYRKFRCKAKCGVSCRWTIGQRVSGKWGVISMGNAKLGRNPMPLDFVPFELSNAVLGHGKPEFDTADECETYVRSL